MDSAFWLVGIGIGLASVAGLRAFVPATVVVLAMQLLSGEPGWAVVGVLAALAVAEVALDKPASVERPLNLVMLPVRAVAGALVLALAVDERETSGALAALAGGDPAGLAATAPWLLAGAGVAGAVAVLKVMLRPRASSGGAGVSHGFLSVSEDAVALVGAVVGLFVPLLPAAGVAFLLFFFHRVRRRRGRKYEGLRILRD